jgi:diketogulonate reductase-like aldo/keto reductase
LLENPELNAIAKLRGCGSAAQVTLAWNIRRGVAVIPKAARGEHQDENLNVESCVLTEEDVSRIEKFKTEKSWVARMNNPCKQYSMPCYRGLEEPNGGEWRNPDHQT